MRTCVILDMRPEMTPQSKPCACVFYARKDGTWAYRFYHGLRAYNRAKAAEQSVQWTQRPRPSWLGKSDWALRR